MANGHGGARIGAGKKRKSLHDKILEEGRNHHPLTVTQFADVTDLNGEEMPPPQDYMIAIQKNGRTTKAVEVYTNTWVWLNERKCTHLIPTQLIEQYAMSVARWIQCEEALNEYGFLAKHPTTGNAMPSPYISMLQSFMKQANNMWQQIYQVVKENNAVDYTGNTPHDDIMERLLSGKGR